MHADDIGRPAGGLGQHIDIERRRVGGEDRVRLAHLAQAGADLSLELQVLEDRMVGEHRGLLELAPDADIRDGRFG